MIQVKKRILLGAFVGFLTLSLIPAVVGADQPVTRIVDPTLFESPQDAVILTGLHRVKEIPPSATDSMIAAEERWDRRTPVGIEVPEGTEEGSAAWMDGKLIKADDVEVAVMYIDTKDGYFIQAGFEYAVPPDQEQKPWLEFVDREKTGKAARCEFVIASDGKNKSDLLELREVVAIDSKKIYLSAMSPDGQELLVAANYSFRSQQKRAAAD